MADIAPRDCLALFVRKKARLVTSTNLPSGQTRESFSFSWRVPKATQALRTWGAQAAGRARGPRTAEKGRRSREKRRREPCSSRAP